MNKQSPRPFSLNLKKARQHWGWTQRQAADCLGIPHKNLQAYEEGRCSAPIPALIQIIKVYRIKEVLAFLNDANFDMANQKPQITESLVEERYLKLKGPQRIAVNALLGVD